MAEAPVRPLVVIENGLLQTMATNPKYVTLFPFLVPLQRAGQAGRGKCCGERARERLALFERAKAAIAMSSPETRDKLKEILRARQLRVRYLEGSKVQQKTI